MESMEFWKELINVQKDVRKLTFAISMIGVAEAILAFSLIIEVVINH